MFSPRPRYFARSTRLSHGTPAMSAHAKSSAARYGTALTAIRMYGRPVMPADRIHTGLRRKRREDRRKENDVRNGFEYRPCNQDDEHAHEDCRPVTRHERCQVAFHQPGNADCGEGLLQNDRECDNRSEQAVDGRAFQKHAGYGVPFQLACQQESREQPVEHDDTGDLRRGEQAGKNPSKRDCYSDEPELRSPRGACGVAGREPGRRIPPVAPRDPRGHDCHDGYHQDARHDARNKKITRRQSEQHTVDDEDQARRDDDTDDAARCGGRRGEMRLVAAPPHLGDHDATHGRGGCGVRPADRGKAAACDSRCHRELAG